MGRNLNYKNEPIPTPDLLLQRSVQVLTSISDSKPIRLMGNLVDSSGAAYLGRNYFLGSDRKGKPGRTNRDFSGLYVFFENETPVYVGISKTIIRRLRQHLMSDRENQASFVYMMSVAEHQKRTNEEYKGLRKDFPFADYRITLQRKMKEEWKFLVVPLEGGYFMSFAEIYVSAALRTKWNSFETH